jgi:hypothetical protein
MEKISFYTRLRLRARHPLCGTGVVSLIAVIPSPALWSPRTADSRPAPGPFKFTSTSFMPIPMAIFAASCAATVAAKAEDFLDPEKLTFPADAQAMTRPEGSVMAIIVLLKVALTCAIPEGTFRADFLFDLTTFLVGAGLLFKVRNSSIIFSY